jgi:hypothetical protein
MEGDHPQEIQDELDLVVDDALKGARSHLQSDGLFTYSVTLNMEWALATAGQARVKRPAREASQEDKGLSRLIQSGGIRC